MGVSFQPRAQKDPRVHELLAQELLGVDNRTKLYLRSFSILLGWFKDPLIMISITVFIGLDVIYI